MFCWQTLFLAQMPFNAPQVDLGVKDLNDGLQTATVDTMRPINLSSATVVCEPASSGLSQISYASRHASHSEHTLFPDDAVQATKMV